jgi:hypothetical protein
MTEQVFNELADSVLAELSTELAAATSFKIDAKATGITKSILE